MAQTREDFLTPLIREHSTIVQELESIRNTLQSQTPAPKLLKLVDDLGEGMKKHFVHEERSLYRQLKIRLREDSPTDEMTLDHESIRRDFVAFRQAVGKNGEKHSIVRIQRLFDIFQRKLKEHIKKEERVLFWLADVKLGQ